MEMMSRVQKSEEKVKNVFKQLLERLSLRNSNKKKVVRSSGTSQTKEDISIGRRFSVGIAFKSHCPPKKTPDMMPRTVKSSFIHQKKRHLQCFRRVAIKGSLSNRCRTDHTTEPQPPEIKVQEYNQLLITKSYMFSGLDIQKTSNGSKLKGMTCSNFQGRKELNIKHFKRERDQRHKNFSFAGVNEEDGRMKTECLSKLCSVGFQPWQTETLGEQF